MAIRDIRSNLRSDIALRETIAADGSVLGGIIDTANFDMGIMFLFMINAFTSGSATFRILQSDDAGWSTGVTELQPDQLIGALPTLDDLTAVPTSPSDEDTDVPIASVGIFGNKRYVRIEVTGAGGAAFNLLVLRVVQPEHLPAQPLEDSGVINVN